MQEKRTLKQQDSSEFFEYLHTSKHVPQNKTKKQTDKKKKKKPEKLSHYLTCIYWGHKRNYSTHPRFGLMLPYIC